MYEGFAARGAKRARATARRTTIFEAELTVSGKAASRELTIGERPIGWLAATKEGPCVLYSLCECSSTPLSMWKSCFRAHFLSLSRCIGICLLPSCVILASMLFVLLLLSFPSSCLASVSVLTESNRLCSNAHSGAALAERPQAYRSLYCSTSLYMRRDLPPLLHPAYFESRRNDLFILVPEPTTSASNNLGRGVGQAMDLRNLWSSPSKRSNETG